ncbi:Bug family tripartite tricarboxylate transporter substrate binding protein [Vibrio salinus]|uniref:Bug family tripartite tricarboxylate transporter substrate binding protein n=1 Tax=Vibrio salinus TaxID=2899784 RepID=UPI001E4794F9|nr:tripartite tricarboxylate transporter substrate binding protein [Vibrio salinus]MCE0495634.1 tripartite tricarboxylate transporter substrate binding protein [Vibrio salinus]
MKAKNILTALFSTGCLLMSGISMAASFPAKDMTIIVPKSPGGGTDITTRGLIEYAKHYTDKNIIAVNKPGAGGVTGMAQAAAARPDGYTMVMTTVELDILPHLNRSPIDYKAFKFIVAPISEPAGLIVPKDSPFNSVNDFVAYAKSHPGKLRVGNSGVGSIWHLASVAIKQNYGIDYIDVPYSGGSAPAVAALVGKHLDAITVGPGNASSQIASGELKLLGIMSDKRSPLFPDVPTFKELGHEFVVRAWAALAVPSKVSESRFKTLSGIFTKAVNDPGFVKFMNNQGIEVNKMTVKQVNQMVREDNDYYKKLVKKIKL